MISDISQLLVQNYNGFGFILLLFLIFFTIVRFHLIFKVLNYLEEEYNSFYHELNPSSSMKIFFFSGGSLFFGINFIFSHRYILDDYLKKKKYFLLIISIVRIWIFILLIFILIKIKVINLGKIF